MATIFQYLKKIKQLDRKITKSSARIQKWCSHLETEETQYDIAKLIQSVNDMIEQRGKVRHALHEINIKTVVKFQEKAMSIDELIILSVIVLPDKIKTLKLLRRYEKNYGDDKDINVVMNYDPLERDKQIDHLENLKEEADDVLDNINLTTEII